MSFFERWGAWKLQLSQSKSEDIKHVETAITAIEKAVVSIAEDVNAIRCTLAEDRNLFKNYTKHRVSQRVRTYNAAGVGLMPKTLSDFDDNTEHFLSRQLQLTEDEIAKVLDKIEEVRQYT